MVSICNNVFVIGSQSVGNAHVSYIWWKRSNLYYVPLSRLFLRSFRLQLRARLQSLNTFCFLISNSGRHLYAIMFLSNNVSSLVFNVILIISVESQRLWVIQWAFFHVINPFRFLLMFFLISNLDHHSCHDRSQRKFTHDFGNGEGKWNIRFQKGGFKLQIQLWLENLVIQLWKKIFNVLCILRQFTAFSLSEEKYLHLSAHYAM